MALTGSRWMDRQRCFVPDVLSAKGYVTCCAALRHALAHVSRPASTRIHAAALTPSHNSLSPPEGHGGFLVIGLGCAGGRVPRLQTSIGRAVDEMIDADLSPNRRTR